MATPGDMDENVDTAREHALVLELLYGELDDTQVGDAERTVAADDALAAELEAFGQVRGLMRQLPDEDPPQAISAKLMHAAAEQAPAATGPRVEPGGGFVAWVKKFFMPLAMHPAATAIATMVLVVGVAGALYVTGNWKVSEPTAEHGGAQASADRAESKKAEAPRPPADDRMSSSEARPATGKQANTDDNADSVTDVDEAQPDKTPAREHLGKKAPNMPPRTVRLAKPKEVQKITGRTSTEITPTEAERKPDGVRYKDKAKRRVQHTRNGTKTERTKAKKPTPKKKGKAIERKMRALHKKARMAAKKGACARAHKLGQTIRQQDRFYWSNNVRNDPLLRCGKVNAFEAGDKAVTVPTKK